MALNFMGNTPARRTRGRVRRERKQGGLMSTRVGRLTTSSDVEGAFVKLFDQIDRRVGLYIGSAENAPLKEQALLNAVGMLEILKVMYQQDLRQRLRLRSHIGTGIGRIGKVIGYSQ